MLLGGSWRNAHVFASEETIRATASFLRGDGQSMRSGERLTARQKIAVSILIYVVEALLFAAAAVWYWADWRREIAVLWLPAIIIFALAILVWQAEFAGRCEPGIALPLAGVVGVFGFIAVLGIGSHLAATIALYTLILQLVMVTPVTLHRLRHSRH